MQLDCLSCLLRDSRSLGEKGEGAPEDEVAEAEDEGDEEKGLGEGFIHILI